MIVSKIEIKGHFVQWLYSQSEELLSQSLACYTTKQSVFLRIQVHASSQTKGLERAENRERDARVRLARFARVRLFRHEEKNRLFCSLLACQQVLHLWAKQFARELASEWQSREEPFFPRPSHSRLLSRAALPPLLATPQMESLLAGYQSQAGCQRPAVKMATFFVALVDSTTLRRF